MSSIHHDSADAARVPSRVEIVQEGGGWSVCVPGLPVAAEGDTVDVAIMELVDALRDYARDWHDRLSAASNHRENRAFVELIDASDDTRLRDWLVRAARA